MSRRRDRRIDLAALQFDDVEEFLGRARVLRRPGVRVDRLAHPLEVGEQLAVDLAQARTDVRSLIQVARQAVEAIR